MGKSPMKNHTIMRCTHGSVLAACDEPYSSMRTTISGEPGQRMVTTPAVSRQFAAPPILQLFHDLMPPSVTSFRMRSTGMIVTASASRKIHSAPVRP